MVVISGPSAGGSPPPKTVNIFLGYFFMVNFCLGTGFLGVPYSFFYSGYLAAVPTLALAAFVTWLSSTWLLEVMARAQVITFMFYAYASVAWRRSLPDSSVRVHNNTIAPARLSTEAYSVALIIILIVSKKHSSIMILIC